MMTNPPLRNLPRARALLLEEKGLEAAPLFDELGETVEPSHEIAPLARFNAGVAWEQAGERKGGGALRTGGQAMAPGASASGAPSGRYVYGPTSNSGASFSAMADLVLARDDLTAVERLEAYGAKGLAIAETGDADSAERFISKGRDILEDLRLGEGGKVPLEVAQVTSRSAKIRKLRSETIAFVPVPAEFRAKSSSVGAKVFSTRRALIPTRCAATTRTGPR